MSSRLLPFFAEPLFGRSFRQLVEEVRRALVRDLSLSDMAIFQCNLRRTDVRHVDVTNHLKQMARADVRVRLNYRTFGVDPDMGHAKVLHIYARGPGGREKMFQYRDNSIIDGTKFRGWGRGEWGGANDRWSGPGIPVNSVEVRHFPSRMTSAGPPLPS